jgi:hypothetical protein
LCDNQQRLQLKLCGEELGAQLSDAASLGRGRLLCTRLFFGGLISNSVHGVHRISSFR